MFFLARYCRLLEEGTFRGRSADFFYMLLFGSTLLSCVAPFINIQFLGGATQVHLALRAPGLTPREFQRLNRKYDGPLSNVAFNYNLRHYTWEAP